MRQPNPIKAAKDKDIVNFNEEEAHIRAYLEKKEDEIRIDMHLRKNKSKGIAIDGVPHQKSGGASGHYESWYFFPRKICPLSRTVRQSADISWTWNCVSWMQVYLYNLNQLQPDCEPAQPAVKGYLPESVPAGYAVGLG